MFFSPLIKALYTFKLRGFYISKAVSNEITHVKLFVTSDADVMPSQVTYTDQPTLITYDEAGPYGFDVDLTIAQADYDIANNTGAGVNYEISYFFASEPVFACK